MINIIFDSKEEYELIRTIIDIGILNSRRYLETVKNAMELPDNLDVTYSKSDKFKK